MKLSAASLKDLALSEITDEKVQSAIRLLLSNIKEFGRQAVLTIEANEPLPVAWTNISVGYLFGWGDFGIPYQPGRYGIDKFGIVHLEGVAVGGAIPSIIFTLPAGFRPLNTHLFAIRSGAGGGAIEVAPNGNVTVTVGSIVSTSLSGITFSVN